ncbi:MAG: hypothetical protein H6837_08325 [Planctomycetes bacterium]|nr:hypothetical protein [Planctomycetota bacterium]
MGHGEQDPIYRARANTNRLTRGAIAAVLVVMLVLLSWLVVDPRGEKVFPAVAGLLGGGAVTIWELRREERERTRRME